TLIPLGSLPAMLSCSLLLGCIERLARHARFDECGKRRVHACCHPVIGRLSLRRGEKAPQLPTSVFAAGEAAGSWVRKASADRAGMVAEGHSDASFSSGRAGKLRVESLAERC